MREHPPPPPPPPSVRTHPPTPLKQQVREYPTPPPTRATTNALAPPPTSLKQQMREYSPPALKQQQMREHPPTPAPLHPPPPPSTPMHALTCETGASLRPEGHEGGVRREGHRQDQPLDSREISLARRDRYGIICVCTKVHTPVLVCLYTPEKHPLLLRFFVQDKKEKFGYAFSSHK